MNPVAQPVNLSFDFAGKLAGGTTPIVDAEAWIKQVHCRTVERRGSQARGQTGISVPQT
jgi:hypothetical protein